MIRFKGECVIYAPLVSPNGIGKVETVQTCFLNTPPFAIGQPNITPPPKLTLSQSCCFVLVVMLKQMDVLKAPQNHSI